MKAVLFRIASLFREKNFPGSAPYWEARYGAGGTSGDGSYGRLAAFKAEIINEFVSRHNIASVIEFGCGDGSQLSLMHYPKYVGLDVSGEAVRMCASRFAKDQSKSFLLYAGDAFYDRSRILTADAALSLDVIYHLVEDEVFARYMGHLFGAATKFVIIYSTNVSREECDYMLHREFTRWVADNAPSWSLIGQVQSRFPGSGPGQSDAAFYMFAR